MGRPRLIEDDAILAAAREVFLARGAAATTQDVAERVGLSQAAIFKRFATKQELFLGWAQNWCSTERPEMLRLTVRVDPHSPDRIRANGVVVNMPEFRQAFGCKTGEPMAPAMMCRVW